MKVYPHRWQGPNRPIVVTYKHAPWLLDVDRSTGRVTARGPGNGGYAAERHAVAEAAVELYGLERIYTARNYEKEQS